MKKTTKIKHGPSINKARKKGFNDIDQLFARFEKHFGDKITATEEMAAFLFENKPQPWLNEPLTVL